MKQVVIKSDRIVYFSRWNRKGYAVFASLGKKIKIAGLALHICEQALKKSSLKGVIVTLSRSSDEVTEHKTEEEDDPLERAVAGTEMLFSLDAVVEPVRVPVVFCHRNNRRVYITGQYGNIHTILYNTK
jgi:hypothetical protein